MKNEKIKEKFKTSYTLDINTYKEFSNGYFYSRKSFLVTLTLLTFFCFLELILKNYKFAMFYSLFIIFYILFTIFLSKNKINYKRALENNKGNPTNNEVLLTDDEIIGINLDTQNKGSYLYTQIIGIIETKNLIILKLKYNLGLIINKNTLMGGTREELIQYLYSKCSNIKRKKISKVYNKKILIPIFLILNIIILTFGIYFKVTEKDYFSILIDDLKQSNKYEVIDRQKYYMDYAFKKAYLISNKNNDSYAYFFELLDPENAEYYLDYWTYDMSFDKDKIKRDVDTKNGYESRTYISDGENFIAIKKYNYLFFIYDIFEDEEEVEKLVEKINKLK